MTINLLSSSGRNKAIGWLLFVILVDHVDIGGSASLM